MKKIEPGKRDCKLRQLRRRERHAQIRAILRKKRRLESPTIKVRPTRRSLGGRRKTLVCDFICPSVFNLSSAYEDTIEFIMKFRNWGGIRRRLKFHLDMTSIDDITPAGALVLAAELDRWSVLHNIKLRAVDLDKWNPRVRSLLNQMGFFTLLEKSKAENSLSLTPSNIEFLPFYTGDNSDGRPFLRLRDGLELLVGKLRFRLQLFQAVSEALTNVKHHAYRKNQGNILLRRWWISASVDRSKGEVTVMALDHGMGIARTLPATLKEWAINLSSKMLTGASNDAAMIEAAIELGRTSTNVSNRGHGLYRDVKSFVEKHDRACSLRIFSNRGCYELTKTDAGELESKLTNHNAPFGGTLIEWKFGT